jgi:hypothetical protein
MNGLMDHLSSKRDKVMIYIKSVVFANAIEGSTRQLKATIGSTRQS